MRMQDEAAMTANEAHLGRCGFAVVDDASGVDGRYASSRPVNEPNLSGPVSVSCVRDAMASAQLAAAGSSSRDHLLSSDNGASISESRTRADVENVRKMVAVCSFMEEPCKSRSTSSLPSLADASSGREGDACEVRSLSSSSAPSLGAKKGLARPSSALTPPLGSVDDPTSRLRGQAQPSAQEAELKRAKNNFPLAYALAMSLREECLKVKERKTLANRHLVEHEGDAEEVVEYPPWCEMYDPFYSPVIRSADNPYAWSALDVLGPTTERERAEGSIVERAHSLLQDDSVNGSLVGCISYVLRFARCSVSAYAVALKYLRRIVDITDFECDISIDTVWLLFLVCVLVASKYLDDRVHSNAYYAIIGNTTNERLNTIEVLVLRALDYRLYVSTKDYKEIERELALSALSSHGVLRNKTIQQGALFPQFSVAERSPPPRRKSSSGGM